MHGSNAMQCKLQGIVHRHPDQVMANLVHIGKQLGLQNELALLVLLAGLIGSIVLPSDHLLALTAVDVPDDVAARRHVALAGVTGLDIDDRVEEVGFSVLASEVLCFWFCSMSATRTRFPGKVKKGT